jgi:hypothetical protein
MRYGAPTIRGLNAAERRVYFQLAARRPKLQDQYRGNAILFRCAKWHSDETGRTFASAEDATAHAALLAGEFAQDGDWDGYMISVADAYGPIVAEVPERE